MFESQSNKRRRVNYGTHIRIVERLTKQIENQQDEIDELREELYKTKYKSLTIQIPDRVSTEEWSPVTPSYSGVSPQAENYSLESHEQATMIQKIWRGYSVRINTCQHSWVIERGMYGDHTIKYCVKCEEEDGCV